MINRIKKWLIISFLLTTILIVWVAYYSVTSLKLQPNSQEITIQPKSSLRSIANQLVKQGVLKEPWRFIIIAKVLRKESFLQAGDYTLNRNVTPYQLLLSLNHGKSTQGSVTFIEGRTFEQMRVKLKVNDAVKQTISVLTETEILRFIGSEYTVAEGLFFPDTYYFDRNTADIVMLKRSYDAMKNKLEDAWHKRAPGLPYKNSAL